MPSMPVPLNTQQKQASWPRCRGAWRAEALGPAQTPTRAPRCRHFTMLAGLGMGTYCQLYYLPCQHMGAHMLLQSPTTRAPCPSKLLQTWVRATAFSLVLYASTSVHRARSGTAHHCGLCDVQVWQWRQCVWWCRSTAACLRLSDGTNLIGLGCHAKAFTVQQQHHAVGLGVGPAQLSGAILQDQRDIMQAVELMMCSYSMLHARPSL